MKLIFFEGKTYLEPTEKMLLLLLAKRKGIYYGSGMRRLKHSCEIEVASKMLYQIYEGKTIIVKLPDCKISLKYLFMSRTKMLDQYIVYAEARKLYNKKVIDQSSGDKTEENNVIKDLLSIQNTREVRSRSRKRNRVVGG